MRIDRRLTAVLIVAALALGAQSTALAESVGPLLQTAWHQRAPFNQDCPLRPDGEHALVGCVALAWAQLVYYHYHDDPGFTGIGEHSHGGETVDLSDGFDWGAMPLECGALGSNPCEPQENTCDALESAAVAELCHEIGVVLWNSYGMGACNTPEESTAPGISYVVAMTRYFRFANAMVHEGRASHTEESWFAMVKAEINAGRPLLCSVEHPDAEAGHEVLIDGWRESKLWGRQFHFNFGNGPNGNVWSNMDTPPNGWTVINVGRGIYPEDVITVGPQPGIGEYPTIQAAIDASVDGQIVKLLHTAESGQTRYQGPGNQDIDFNGKNVTVRSEHFDASEVYINCLDDPNIDDDYIRGFSFHSGEDLSACLEGLTICSGEAFSKGGGISITNGSACTLSNCVIRHNTAPDGAGIYVADSGVTIRGCTIYANTGHAVATRRAAVTIENSIIAFNTGSSVTCAQALLATIACSDFFGNTGGDWGACINEQLGVNGNIALDPLFCNRDLGHLNLSLQSASPCLPENNQCATLMGPFGFGGNDCYTPDVSPDGSGIYPNIQAAINAAAVGDTIWLADGTFRGIGNRDLDFSGKQIALMSVSWDRDRCIIDCEGNENDPHRAFDFHSGEDENARIENLTIRGGWMDRGGAIRCRNASSPRFGRCRFAGNQAVEGAVVASESNSEPTFIVCIACDNLANKGGFLFADSGGAGLQYCSIAGNTAASEGAALWGHSAEVGVDRTIISANTGAPATYFDGCNVGVICTDIWGNPGGDWTGDIAMLQGLYGNFAADPRFCDPEGCDLSLAPDSPCFSHEDCGAIGDPTAGVCLPKEEPAEDSPAHTAAISLGLAVPNPFNPSTSIRYVLPHAEHPQVTLYDVSGRHVRTLVNEWQEAGEHTVNWDGTYEQGRPAASGVYFVRLQVGGTVAVQKILLAK